MHGKLGKVMEKIMESQGIFKALKSTNPDGVPSHLKFSNFKPALSTSDN